jgi:hypothetical protein
MNFNKINMSKDEQNIVFPRKSQRTSQHGTKNMNSTNPTTNKKKTGTVLRFPPPIKTNRHDIAEILLKVALNTINLS